MTLQELYQNIDGDYDQALRVLRMDKLLDKHIRKLTKNGVITQLLAAGETMDPTALFEAAHAAKGVCANLGLAGQSPPFHRRRGQRKAGRDRRPV